MSKPRIAVLISGSGSNLQALLDAAALPDFPAEIALVLSNKSDAFGLTRAAKSGVETNVIAHQDYADRAAFDGALHAALVEARIDYVCLAGFMRILTPEFVSKWEGRMLNIHPSLLPLFPGLHTHRAALASGMRFAGCTVHFVVAEMDAGPIVAQAVVPILPDDTEETLGARVLAKEHKLYPQAMRWLAEGALSIVNDRVVIDAPLQAVKGIIHPQPDADSAA